jgi:hypothetical protein
MEDTCNVCCELFNKLSRRKVLCEFCEFSSCNTCTKKYILESAQDAHCMNCRRNWDRYSLLSKFGGTFMKGPYKQYRERVLFERERALLPASQPIVEEIIRQRQVKAEMAEIDNIIREFDGANLDEDGMMEIFKLQRRKRELQKSLKEREKTERKVFIRPCAAANCKGFINSKYVCGLCGASTCSACFEVNDADHKCDETNIETAKLLKQETKPCPECHIPIFKISGCDQMFCTQCQTVFSWRTGQREKGAVHNPHYFEWLRTQGRLERAPGDFQCGRELDHFLVNRFLWIGIGFERMRQLVHLRTVILPTFRVDEVNTNRDLRVKYLMNEITEEQFRTRIQRAEKSNEKKREIYTLLTMFIQCMTDILYRVDQDIVPLGILQEIEELREYVNDRLSVIAKAYDSTSLYISRGFSLY